MSDQATVLQQTKLSYHWPDFEPFYCILLVYEYL